MVMADKSEIYSNDSEALEKWITDCFTDHHPPARYYHHQHAVKNIIPISVPKPVVPVPKKEKGFPVMKKEKEKPVVHEKRVMKLDSVSALEETQRFVANFLRVDNAKRMIVSQQPRTTRPGLENNSGVKRKFDDDVNNEVKKIMHRKPEQRKCVADPIGKASSRGQILANKKYKFQPLVC
ncbi:hypothetical protein DCAR_0623991 [Daucus carota subsp. sativus]|uniref:Uncharacterized protein n=1 Tax=Daucus carota subsp. sativus TaxID=79200 RepID=A0A164VKA8_DAUCS|nr:hypothetical protein DCAR_0623991 [Daucus carota subsp. sativus]